MAVKIASHAAPYRVGHEIGVMVGFMAVFVIAMGAYLVAWKGELGLFFSIICSRCFFLEDGDDGDMHPIKGLGF